MSDQPDENYEIENPEIKKLLRDMGGSLKEAMPEGWGFNLMIFSYGEGGALFYIASAQREDMVRAFREFLQKQSVEAGTDETAANIIGRLIDHFTQGEPDESWDKIMPDAMLYLQRAKREHPNSAKAFWDRLKTEGLVS